MLKGIKIFCGGLQEYFSSSSNQFSVLCYHFAIGRICFKSLTLYLRFTPDAVITAMLKLEEIMFCYTYYTCNKCYTCTDFPLLIKSTFEDLKFLELFNRSVYIFLKGQHIFLYVGKQAFCLSKMRTYQN